MGYRGPDALRRVGHPGRPLFVGYQKKPYFPAAGDPGLLITWRNPLARNEGADHVYQRSLGEEEELSKKEIAATIAFGLGLALLLFLAAPVLGTKGIGALLGETIENPIIFNLVEGALRIAIFIAYLLIITAASRDIKRFFAYHGAEHKAIKVHEAGEELVPKNARKLDTTHVRCGTSFVLYVLVLSILIFSLLGTHGWLFMVLSRIVVIPLVAGIAFEFIMWSARKPL